MPPRGTEFQPRLPGEARLGLHADRHHGQAAADHRAVVQEDVESPRRQARRPWRRRRGASPRRSAGAPPARGRPSRGPRCPARAASFSTTVTFSPPALEGLGQLQADVAGADHHGALDGGAVRGPQDGVHVLQVPQGQDPGIVRPGHRQPHGRGSRAQHQGVIGLPVLPAGEALPHQHFLRLPVHPQDLAVHAHVQVEAGPEALGGLHQQLAPVRDVAPDVVGQSAVGERDVGPPLEQDDAGGLRQSPGPGGRAGAPRHSPHDDDALRLGHGGHSS